jgi:hypothetical protein
MSLLDFETLSGIDAQAFRSQRPYPWVNLHGALTRDAYQTLTESLPELDLFTKTFGKQRKYGQNPHDRYALVYDRKLPVSEAWHALAREIEGPNYHAFLTALLGTDRYRLQ